MQLIKKIKIARLKKNRDCAILSIGPIRSKSPFFYLQGSIILPYSNEVI